MMAVGAANPRAHGQAMISTATVAVIAYESRGSGPNTIQMPNVRTAISSTAGTK
jgi:hypothetical protein